MEYLNDFAFFNFLASISRSERSGYLANLSKDSTKLISKGFYNILVNLNIQCGDQKKAIKKQIVIMRSIADSSLPIGERIVKIKSNANLVKLVSLVLARYLTIQILNSMNAANNIQKSEL